VGLRAEYYDNVDFTGPLLVRTDPVVDFSWGGGSPDPSIGADSFSARWTGFVRPLFSETYTFYTVSDDGRAVVHQRSARHQQFTDHGDTENVSIGVPMQAGVRYSIRMEFYENGGGATARLFWSSPTQLKETVPAKALFLPPVVSIADVSKPEGNSGTTAFQFQVNLSTSSPIPVTVTYNTANGTAAAPSDYTSATNQPLVFAPARFRN